MAKHIFYIGVVAALLVISHLLLGYPDGHSTHYNEPWLQAFSSQFQAGDLLPRWLVDYPQGLGAPVFYIYSLTPFYLGTVIDMACGGCGGRNVLSLTHFALFFLSGVSFYLWGRFLAAPKWALAGALIYMLLPYHFLDVEWRNAIGEASTYIAMPLILLGIGRAVETGRFPVMASCAYAFMILCHVPSALIFSMMIGLAALGFHCRERLGVRQVRAAIFTSGKIGTVGALLASFYLLPALLLQDYLLAEGWLAASGDGYLPEKWVLPYGLFQGPFGIVVYGAFIMSCLVGLAAAVAAWWEQRGKGTPEQMLPVVFATALLLCLLFVSPLALPLWLYVEPLRMIQFPWRFGIIVDVASASLCVLWLTHGAHQISTRIRYVLVAGVFGGLIIGISGLTFVTYIDSENRRELRAEHTIARHVVPPEYRTKWALESDVQQAATPDGFNTPADYDAALMAWLDYVAKREQVEAARPLADGEVLRAQRSGAVQFDIEATLSANAVVHFKQNWWPHWRLVDQATGAEIETFPETKAGLVAFELPAGRYHLRLQDQALPQEELGWAGSTLGLLLLVTGYVLSRRRSRAA